MDVLLLLVGQLPVQRLNIRIKDLYLRIYAIHLALHGANMFQAAFQLAVYVVKV